MCQNEYPDRAGTLTGQPELLPFRFLPVCLLDLNAGLNNPDRSLGVASSHPGTSSRYSLYPAKRCSRCRLVLHRPGLPAAGAPALRAGRWCTGCTRRTPPPVSRSGSPPSSWWRTGSRRPRARQARRASGPGLRRRGGGGRRGWRGRRRYGKGEEKGDLIWKGGVTPPLPPPPSHLHPLPHTPVRRPYPLPSGYRPRWQR
jgi:hypothetical protein